MSEPTDTPRPALVVLASAGILLLAGVLAAVVHMTEPEVEREGAVKRTAMLVEVTGVEVGTFTPQLPAMGQVRPSQELDLAPRVAGQVIELGAGFVPGRVVDAGALLVRLDAADARNALVRSRGQLLQAEADLAQERGRQAVARTERAQLDRTLSDEQEALILRQPQLQAAQAAVESARAAAHQAQLELDRTEVRAPFAALVGARDTAVGALVNPGSSLGRLIAVDRFWVELTLPVAQLRHLPPLGESAPPVRVELRDRAAWPDGVVRTGVLEGVVQQLDATTRLARVLVAVDDPLARSFEGPPLVAGAWVEARVPGATIADAVRLPRPLLRKGDTVWVMEGDALRIAPVQVALQDSEFAYISGGLDPDALVVTTNLATVTDGAPLRTEAK